MAKSKFSDLAIDLIEAAAEAAAHGRGERTGVVVHHAIDPREVRERAGLTQEKMAPLLGLSASGYRKLEQGQRSISGPVEILLKVIDAEPDAVRRAITAA